MEIWGDHPVLEYLKKGKQVSVDAHYSASKKGEGDEAKYYHSFKVENIILLGGAKNDQ
ncbi:MAG: hypothetical protein U5K27_04635 [Desulfotignum sp.]|nr:hypothetical protein [Desulfotignum sp.]